MGRWNIHLCFYPVSGCGTCLNALISNSTLSWMCIGTRLPFSCIGHNRYLNFWWQYLIFRLVTCSNYALTLYKFLFSSLQTAHTVARYTWSAALWRFQLVLVNAASKRIVFFSVIDKLALFSSQPTDRSFSSALPGQG